jgi:ketosteroid isomerase-like protein
MNRILASCRFLSLGLACWGFAAFACCTLAAQTPAPAPAPAPASPTSAPAAGATSTQAAAVAQFQKIEDAWSEAVNHRDQYGLELVLSPLLVDVSAAGNVTTRNQQVAQTISGDDKTINLEQRVVTVRPLGDVAVVNGTYVLHHKVNSAQVDEKGVFTHVFQRVRGGWVCVNSQRTLLREDAAAKSKKSQQSTSGDSLHIPFFGKGEKGSD